MIGCRACEASSGGACARHSTTVTYVVHPFVEVSPAPPRRPFRCPVCEGRGQVPAGFYDGLPGTAAAGAVSLAPEFCRSCDGTGVLWGSI